MDYVSSEDEKRRSRGRSLRKRAVSASTRLTYSLRKRGSRRVADFPCEAISIEDIRDAEEEKAVNAFRQALVEKDLLPVQHDSYHTMLRYVDLSFYILEIELYAKDRCFNLTC